MRKITSSIKGICEEFCDYVYEDASNNSYLLNVPHTWFIRLSDVLKRHGFKCIHTTKMENTITCVFHKS
jgi:hypothetical protein